MKTKLLLSLMIFMGITQANAQTLNLPPRPVGALTGDEFVNLVTSYTLTNRENEIYNQVMSGNVPDFQRNLVAVNGSATINTTVYNYTYYVLPDYLAIGCDTNYFLCPMTPLLAQLICNATGCTMPTRQMVNEIWSSAPLHLPPTTIPPSPQMITIPVMGQHNSDVWAQRQPLLGTYPLGTLTGGDKKDVVISNIIYGYPLPGRVVIYGWHYTSGTPIQPLYNGHEETYADYSHGIRLVQNQMVLNGSNVLITNILQDPVLYDLLSDEGVIAVPHYPGSTPTLSTPNSFAVITETSQSFDILINPQAGATHYLVDTGSDGLSFPQSIFLQKDSLHLSGLTPDALYYVRIAAVNSYDTTAFSEVLAVTLSDCSPNIIIVNSFDRAYTGNTYNFVRQHAAAYHKRSFSLVSATNEAITEGLINLNDYRLADYIMGVESSLNETFSDAEQDLVEDFLKQGGYLFVSGSEIAWDLDHLGSVADQDFYHNYLKAAYVYDAPNNQSATYYQAESTAVSIFSGLPAFSFDNGTHGTFNVSYPDVINAVNGSQSCLQYSGLTANYAGISFSGLFPSGTLAGKLVNLGFPFETVYPESMRDSLMGRILTFFNLTPAGITPLITQSGDTLYSSALSGNQWFCNGSLLTGDTGNFILPQQSGNYIVMTEEDGCWSDSSAAYYYLITSIPSSEESDPYFSIFPNPVKEKLFIECSRTDEAYNAVIYNSNGQSLIEQTIRGQVAIDLSGLCGGIYILIIQGQNTMWIEKFVK